MKKSNVLWKTIIYLTLAFLLLLYSTAMFPLHTILYEANPPYFMGYITVFVLPFYITIETILIYTSEIIGLLLSIVCFIFGYRNLYKAYSERTPHRWIPIAINEFFVVFYFYKSIWIFFQSEIINASINNIFAFVLFFLPIILYGFSPDNDSHKVKIQRQ